MIDKVIDVMDEEQKSPELRKELSLKKMQKYKFTQREVEITQLLMEGYQNKEIGAKIFISARTVDNHIYNIFKKAGCQNRVELLNKLLLE